MIDLIIPYYNNPEGLIRTLESINTDIFYITIIDDHSSIHMSPILKVDQVLRYNKNMGPGYARQWGINHTNNPYIMFIDTGDEFISQEIQEYILRVVKANPKNDVISFPYYYKGEITSDTDNRMHGKIYKRKFLEKYNITFASEDTYMNEDIGFNHACRMCGDILFMSKPVINWIEDKNSLTQKNNNEALYKKQTRALSLNIIHAIENCKAHHITVLYEICQIACALYYWVIRTIVEKPEFAQDAWSGAKIFFDKYKDEIYPNQLVGGNTYLKKIWNLRNKIKFPINILRFTDEILKNEILPNYYLT